MLDSINKKSLGERLATNLREYVVTYVFLVLSLVFVAASGQPLTVILFQLMNRLSRNLFIILALIIPIIAGMGINFAITIGAMAAQVGLLLAINWGVKGMAGLILAGAITLPLAAGFGFLIGALLNKMKGQETIGSLILGYFANGAYQLLFLFIFGKLIPLNPSVTIVGATGVANTLIMSGQAGMQSALDSLWRVDFSAALYGVSAIVLLAAVGLYLTKQISQKQALRFGALALGLSLLYTIPIVKAQFVQVTVPVITFLVVAALCLFNVLIMRTKLGQKFRAVGQNRVVANAAGIHVNKVRIKAIVISTVLAGWGQIIFIQNLGTLQTYAAHEMVGLYAGAAILVGGASINRATNTQAIIGCILFHTLFVVSQDAGTVLFGDPAIGEFFRVFLCYGVIAVALVMHAWKSAKKPAQPQLEGAK